MASCVGADTTEPWVPSVASRRTKLSKILLAVYEVWEWPEVYANDIVLPAKGVCARKQNYLVHVFTILVESPHKAVGKRNNTE